MPNGTAKAVFRSAGPALWLVGSAAAAMVTLAAFMQGADTVGSITAFVAVGCLLRTFGVGGGSRRDDDPTSHSGTGSGDWLAGGENDD
ncbi:hypothetical protein DU478_03880 [Thalassococcus profundi]|uniref:Uncharacterized protein n=1 Tax=Thalassococcus profundi TaxID=2282382 RepID=A0A369TUH4_9RHOB|nr:hypothetical protein [Thalassococcus profundi]RDD67807.1 hypothetical protein DU478_03880 [Thalassococcus profundi]